MQAYNAGIKVECKFNLPAFEEWKVLQEEPNWNWTVFDFRLCDPVSHLIVNIKECGEITQYDSASDAYADKKGYKHIAVNYTI
jgi:hypothetical protein